MNIIEFKTKFQFVLKRAIETKFEEYKEYTQDKEILNIIKYSESIIGGGKCIRPYMAYTMYETLSGEDLDQVLDLLVSLEIFHTFALVHDDVIDEGQMRHKVDTVHEFVSKGVDNTNIRDKTHYGHSQAILVGDLLFSWAIGRFYKFAHLPYYQQAWQVFYQMIDEVAIGQMIDVNIMTRTEISSELIETKMKLKTAGYTFVRPMQIGVSLAGKQKELEQFCSEFGIALGLAFQTQDDLLDIIADPKIIKKSILSDIREHQHTFLTQYILDNASENDIQELKQYWGNPNITDNDQVQIVKIFQRTGALDYARNKVSQYLSQAKELVSTEKHLTDKTRLALNELIQYIENRGY